MLTLKGRIFQAVLKAFGYDGAWAGLRAEHAAQVAELTSQLQALRARVHAQDHERVALVEKLEEADADLRFEADSEDLVRIYRFTGTTMRAALTKLAAWEGWDDSEPFGKDVVDHGPIDLSYDEDTGTYIAILTSIFVEADGDEAPGEHP